MKIINSELNVLITLCEILLYTLKDLSAYQWVRNQG